MKSGLWAPAWIVQTILCWMLPLPAAARALSPNDYLRLEQVSAPQISPDGQTIIYTRTRVNVEEDRFEKALWIVDAAGKHNRRFMPGGSEVRWSPDGRRIAYLDRTEQSNAIFTRRMDASDSIRRIVLPEAIEPYTLRWSPDGRSIAFMARVSVPSDWDIALPAKPAGARWTNDAIVIDKLHYQLDGAGLLSGLYSHIFVVPAAGGAPKQLTRGAWHAEPLRAGLVASRGDLEWIRDGRSRPSSLG